MAMTKEEREHIYYSLHMRANWIETGNPNMSAQDAIKRNNASRGEPFSHPIELNEITHEQQKLCIGLRDLAFRILQTGA